MKDRVWALVQVGRYIGVDAMLTQIKAEEKEDLKSYLKRFFLNAHGTSQVEEMKINTYTQEGAELGYKYLTALRNSLY